MRFRLVDYRLAGVTAVGVLIIPWIATWKEPVDRARTPPPHGGQNTRILGMAFSPDGKTIAASRDDQSVILRNLVRRETVARQIACPIDAFVLTFSPDGRFLALGGTQPDILLCDLRLNGAALSAGNPGPTDQCSGILARRRDTGRFQ